MAGIVRAVQAQLQKWREPKKSVADLAWELCANADGVHYADEDIDGRLKESLRALETAGVFDEELRTKLERLISDQSFYRVIDMVRTSWSGAAAAPAPDLSDTWAKRTGCWVYKLVKGKEYAESAPVKFTIAVAARTLAIAYHCGTGIVRTIWQNTDLTKINTFMRYAMGQASWVDLRAVFAVVGVTHLVLHMSNPQPRSAALTAATAAGVFMAARVMFGPAPVAPAPVGSPPAEEVVASAPGIGALAAAAAEQDAQSIAGRAILSFTAPPSAPPDAEAAAEAALVAHVRHRRWGSVRQASLPTLVASASAALVPRPRRRRPAPPGGAPLARQKGGPQVIDNSDAPLPPGISPVPSNSSSPSSSPE